MEVGVLSFPKTEGEQCLRIYTYEKNLVLYCTIEVLVMSDESQVEKQNEIQIPFSCKVFLVAWWWQEASSVSWSDFEGDEGEVSPETEDKVSLSGSRNPSWDSVTWCDEKAPWLATGMRSATPESDTGEEILQPLGRSDLVMCGFRETEGCWAKRSHSKLWQWESVPWDTYLEMNQPLFRKRNLWMLAYFRECTAHDYSPINNAANTAT